MGNAQAKHHPRARNKKQVHWKAADRPVPPGKPYLLLPDADATDLVTIAWSRPTDDGGSPISGYLVEHRRIGSAHWLRATPAPVPFPELTLSGLEPGWRYQFRVLAENAVGFSDAGEASDPITVTLQRSAVAAPKFTQELENAVALENDKREFVVHFMAQPPPRVCWFKDGFEVFSSRRVRILTEHDRSVLTIHQTQLSDEGEIKCTLTNKAGHVSAKCKLIIEAPPSVRLPRQYEEGLLFEIGEIIRLKVQVAGRPTPLAFWSHDGESLQNNDRYEIEYADKSLSLKINEARRSDRGEYLIKAVNKLGEDLTSFLVTVTDKPSPPGKARVVMTLGRSVTLSWEIPQDDGGCKIGNYIVEYFRVGWNVWLKAATCRQLTTILGDLIEGSEYKFRVKAESPYGISEPSEESEVIFIPDPKRGLVQPTEAVRRKNELIKFATDLPPEAPKRPKRTKVKTPEMPRKEINKSIFDRASMVRDLAYGSPDIQKELEPVRRKSVSPIPEPTPAMYKLAIEPPKELLPGEVGTRRNSEDKRKLIREHSRTISGSSEFILLLYSDENERDQSDIFDFESRGIPPPLSFSAPELGVEPPPLFQLRPSFSSTELLHERTMMRFNQEAENEERETQRIHNIKIQTLLDIPKIQINSKDSEDIVGLERKFSFRRKSVGAVVQQQRPLLLQQQRRHSLSGANNKRMESQASFEKREVTVGEEAKWLQEYEESMSESSSESSESNIFKYSDEEDTYHPGRPLRTLKRNNSEPFEILTKPKDLPSPDFIPKPILKKTDTNSPPMSPTKAPRSLSPRPDPVLKRNRSKSLAVPSLSPLSSSNEELSDPPKPRDRSPSLSFKKERKGIVTAAVQISGITAASVVLKDKLLVNEEAKVVADHYGDIVKTFGQRRKSNPKIYLDRDSLKKVADNLETPQEEEEPNRDVPSSGENLSNDSGYTESSIDVKTTKEIGMQTPRRNHSPSPLRSQSRSSSKGSLDRHSPRRSHSPSPLRSQYRYSPKRSFEEHSPRTNHSPSPLRSQSRNSSKGAHSPRRMSYSERKSPARSKSPSRRETNIHHMPRKSLPSPSGRRSTTQSRSPSKRSASITRRPGELTNNLTSDGGVRQTRRTSPSPLRKATLSPPQVQGRRPMLKEITTQTSIGLESSPPPRFLQRQESLLAEAEVKVRRSVDYITDLAMFAVACWLYIFDNELLAIPVLLIMVYRQLREEIGKRVPKWVLNKIKKDQNKKK